MGEVHFPLPDPKVEEEKQALVPSSALSRSEASVLPPSMHARASSDLTPIITAPKPTPSSSLKRETTPEREETPSASPPTIPTPTLSDVEISGTEETSSSSDPLIVLMEVQLRQGNLSELNKLMERVLTSPWFHVK